ncbi:outer membrane protein assembly factor BamE domain-containing protein [Methylovorus mays]|uniref:outer membrane protein assembly factor BamE domain-containing protein n=1 Tax=Methylovorus mays TaxID=184077 RepID=UPI001E2B009E|nr:outer membrane protein assembly factor BamE [Methylovorus mays]MCB5205928.1 outer membrane protein assembly factor BamE [Methylovorus mays]
MIPLGGLRLRFYFYIAILFLQTSCAIAPYINCADGKKVQVGMTQDEVVKLMGDPYFVSLSKGSVVFGWQDNEDVRQAKNDLQVTINPQTKLIDKVEGTCSQ